MNVKSFAAWPRQNLRRDADGAAGHLRGIPRLRSELLVDRLTPLIEKSDQGFE